MIHKIFKLKLLTELEKLRYSEVLYEGEVRCLLSEMCYEYNLMDEDCQDTVNIVFDQLYDKKDAG